MEALIEVEGRRREEAERNRISGVVRRRNERRVAGVKGESVRSRSAEENAIEELLWRLREEEGFIGLLMALEIV